jgi:hypothetical protein
MIAKITTFTLYLISMLAKDVNFVALGVLSSPIIFAQNTFDAFVKDASTHDISWGNMPN